MGKNILIIDDAGYIIDGLKFVLKTKGLSVYLASDGKQAIKTLENNPVDLILTDLHMPNMDGFEMTRTIRKEEKYKVLPIIAYTGFVDPANIDKATKAGVTEIINKPLTVEKVYLTIQKYL